jgi:hypothetical protein
MVLYGWMSNEHKRNSIWDLFLRLFVTPHHNARFSYMSVLKLCPGNHLKPSGRSV